jgi:hypothetical protein
MHVGATFWAIKWGYGLPVASIPQPDLTQVETVNGKQSIRNRASTNRDAVALRKPVLLHHLHGPQ